jgi:hypothetical protein
MEVVCECQSAPDTLPQTFATPAADTSDTWLSHASARRRAGQGRHERSCRCEAAAGEHLLEPYALHVVWPLHLPLHLCEGGRQTPPFTPSVLSVHHQPHPPHLPQERTGANDDDDQSSVDIKAVPILHSNQAGFRGLSCNGKRWQCKVEKYDKQTGAYKEVSLCQSIPHDSPKVSSPIPIPSYHCCLSFPSTATATGSPPRSVGGVAVKG